MTAAYPSSQNVFVRNHDATNKLVIDFARNLKKFPVNQYCQIVPVGVNSGLYMQMTVEEAGRIIDSTLSNFAWPDGQPAPEGAEGTESHEWQPYTTVRRAFPFTLGNLTVKQATWDIVAKHASIKARQAMTARTQLAITALTTTASYAASHRIDISAISGVSGTWAESTTARSDIQRSIIYATERILDDTLDAIEPDDLQLVINSELAGAMRVSQEIVDYIKGSPEAYAQVRGELAGRNKYYGLPDKLYGVNVVVEATRKVTTRKGQTRAVSQILPTATPFLCARPGALVAEEGPNFSTCCIFAFEEMTVENKVGDDNRRTKGRVVDDVSAAIVAPASGVIFSNAV